MKKLDNTLKKNEGNRPKIHGNSAKNGQKTSKNA